MGATPGARLFDHFAVRNYSQRPLPLTVQTADALNTPTGDFAVTPPNQPIKQVGTWITLFPPHGTRKIVVPKRSFLVIPFTVAVPLNAQPGDHAGGITVTLASIARSQSGQNFRLLQSVGSRVFIRVGGDLHPQLSVEDLRVSYDSTLWPFQRRSAVVRYTVHNTGNVAIGGLQSVKISGLLHLGRSADKLPPVGLLLPGFAATQRVVINGLVPQILMSSDVSIRPLVLPGTALNVRGPFTGSVHFWAVPWLLIALILLGVGGWILNRRRRRRSGDKAGSDQDQPGATLEVAPETTVEPAGP